MNKFSVDHLKAQLPLNYDFFLMVPSFLGLDIFNPFYIFLFSLSLPFCCSLYVTHEFRWNETKQVNGAEIYI